MSENKNNSSKNESLKDKVDLFPIFRTMAVLPRFCESEILSQVALAC